MARRTGKKEMSGIFDFFRKKKPQGGGLIPAPQPKKLSIIDVLRQKPQLPAKIEPGQRALTIREVLAPKRPAVPQAEKKPTQWKEIIPAPPSRESKPISEVVRQVLRPAAPTPVAAPAKYVFLHPSGPPEIGPRRPYGLILSPEKRLDWRLPTPEGLAQHFRKTHDLDAMFNYIRQQRADPEFKKEQLLAAWRGIPNEVSLGPIVEREKYTDFASFYGIPWAVMELYQDVPPEQAAQADEALWVDIISPLNAMVPEAFSLLKPDDLPGFFNVNFKEPKKLTPKQYEEIFRAIETEIQSLSQAYERLNRLDPEWQQKAEYLRNEIEARYQEGEQIEASRTKPVWAKDIGYHLFYVEPLMDAGGHGAT